MDQGVRGAGTAGFTLIELMIVVMVLSLLTLSVSLGVTRPRSTNAQDWSRFAALHARLRAQAILSGEVLGLAVDGAGYQRLRRQGGDWQAVGDRGAWRAPVTVLEPRVRQSVLTFTPGGQGSAARLRFETASGAVTCTGDGWGPVTCDGA